MISGIPVAKKVTGNRAKDIKKLPTINVKCQQTPNNGSYSNSKPRRGNTITIRFYTP